MNRWRVYREKLFWVGSMYRIGTDVDSRGRDLGDVIYPAPSGQTIEELRAELHAMLEALDDLVIDKTKEQEAK